MHWSLLELGTGRVYWWTSYLFVESTCSSSLINPENRFVTILFSLFSLFSLLRIRASLEFSCFAPMFSDTLQTRSSHAVGECDKFHSRRSLVLSPPSSRGVSWIKSKPVLIRCLWLANRLSSFSTCWGLIKSVGLVGIIYNDPSVVMVR